MSIKAVLSKLFFADLTPVLRKGRQTIVSEDDMPELEADLNPRLVPDGLVHLKARTPWRFLGEILWNLRSDLGVLSMQSALRLFFSLMSPVLIHSLLSEFENWEDTRTTGALLYALTLGVVGIANGVTLQHFFNRALKLEQLIVNGLNTRIFNHALTLSRDERVASQTGDLVNHMSTDSDSVSEVVMIVCDVVYSIFLTIAVTLLLMKFLGVAAFAGIGVLILISPISKKIAKTFLHLEENIQNERDARVSLLSQILAGIRVVKFFNWTQKVTAEIEEIRARELSYRRRVIVADAFSSLLYISASTLVCIAAFSAHYFLGRTLSPAIVFSSIALFNLLEEPFGNLSRNVSAISSAKVGAARILSFLGKGKKQFLEKSSEVSIDTPALEFRGLSVRYPESLHEVLHNIDLHIEPGESVAIVGPVGSGKSTLLLSILHETPQTAGDLVWSGGARPHIGYVPQESFVLNASLRENICFGAGEDALDSVLNDCLLKKDISLFPAGLDTEIGEHGINLSGGQKSRVSLARAAMADTQVVLLDDPLSAVDFVTEDGLVEKLIFGRWRDKTRIVVTHRLFHLPRFDKIVLLKEGRICAVGSFEDLVYNPEFSSFYSECEDENRTMLSKEKASFTAEQTVGSAHLTVLEDKEKGAVSFSIYKKYMKALVQNKKSVFIGLLALVFVATLMPLLQNLWLSSWVSRQTSHSSVVTQVSRHVSFLSRDVVGLLGYGAMGLAVIIVAMLERTAWMLSSLRAAKAMHERALSGVFNTAIRFFDANPQGRILNRFARDLDSVDRHLPWSFMATVATMASFLVSVAFFLTMLPWVFLIIAPALYIYYGIQRDYRNTAREAKRLDSITRSPRYAQFKETLQGLVVIRAFGKQKLFVERFYDVLARNQRMFRAQVLLNRWFSIRVPLVGGAISIAVCLGVVMAIRHQLFGPSIAGLLFSYALSLWGSLNWCIRAFSECESRMTAVERLETFAKLEPEASVTIPPETLEGWPVRGAIEFDEVVARYAPHLPPVLRGVSFKVTGGERVGIVGRTGAGKSTLFQLLFRFMNPESGAIRIDGKNICGIPLNALRRSIAVIPQDPTLFLGTLRSNLDRFHEWSDDLIWQALQRSQLRDFVETLPGGLDTRVEESGHNFSQGQRQLFCLARALLSRAKIIIMDEATASIDMESDRKIQHAIRNTSRDVTMLIIAHRLETVADCDAIVELAEGKVLSVKRPSEKGSAQVSKIVRSEHLLRRPVPEPC